MPDEIVVTILERPDLGPVVAGWLWESFWRKRGSSLHEIERLVAASKASVGPPRCFVLVVDGDPVGTAGLIAHDCDERPDLTPWLAAMFVAPAWRGRGYAMKLVRTVEEAARAAGMSTLWLYTRTAQGLYARAGWAHVEDFVAVGTAATLMRRDL